MSAPVEAWRGLFVGQRRDLAAQLAAALWCATLWAACATPLPPTGGPTDDTPPHIVETIPENGAVNISEASLRIVFSEHVNERAFQQALSIVPEPETPPELDWRGARVDIRLTDPLREDATYVFTIDTALRDLRGVALATPILLAFSTGPALNAGSWPDGSFKAATARLRPASTCWHTQPAATPRPTRFPPVRRTGPRPIPTGPSDSNT